MKDIKLIVVAVLAAAVIVFVLQNADPVRVTFLAWHWSASRAFVLLLVFLAGVAAGWLGSAAVRRRHRRSRH